VAVPANAGAFDNTTLPELVDGVVQAAPVLPVAVQKLFVVNVPNVVEVDEAIAIRLVPLQYTMMPLTELYMILPALPGGLLHNASALVEKPIRQKASANIAAPCWARRLINEHPALREHSAPVPASCRRY